MVCLYTNKMNGATWKAHWKKVCETYEPLHDGTNTLYDIFEILFDHIIFMKPIGEDKYTKALDDLRWHCRTLQGVLDILHYIPTYLTYLYERRKYKREYLFHLYQVVEHTWSIIGDGVRNKVVLLFDEEIQNALDKIVIWLVAHHSKMNYFEECYQKKELRTAGKLIDLIYHSRLPRQCALLKQEPRVDLETLAMYVWHPSRVEKKLETYGFDYFDMV